MENSTYIKSNPSALDCIVRRIISTILKLIHVLGKSSMVHEAWRHGVLECTHHELMLNFSYKYSVTKAHAVAGL